jgi:hypothetical protein
MRYAARTDANHGEVRAVLRNVGATLVSRRSGIERMVDAATGKAEDDMRRLVEFVYDFVYTRLPRPDSRERERQKGEG